MKVRWIMLVIFVLPILLNGQAVWDQSGIPIRQGDNINWKRNAVKFDQELIYIWTDCRRGDHDIWAQKIDNQGNKLWDEDLLVCGEANRQIYPVVAKTDDDCLIVSWMDLRSDEDSDIYAQKLSADGELLWNTEGVPLCEEADNQGDPKIVSDSVGGAIVVWRDDRDAGGSDIYGNRILSDGNIADGWDVNGNCIIDDPDSQRYQSVCTDGNGGAVVVWYDTRNSDGDLYMQRILPDGTLDWDYNGILLCGAAEMQEKPQIAIDSNQIITIVWRDKRNNVWGDIYLQKVTLDGQILMEDLCICDAAYNQRNPKIISTSDNSSVIVWEDTRNEYTDEYNDLYMQKIDASGNLLWEVNGTPVVMADNDQWSPSICADDQGGCWITWEDVRFENHPDGDVYIQHFDSAGSPLLTNNGNLICDQLNAQYYPSINLLDGDVTVIFGDSRTGSQELYVQSIDQAGNLLLPVEGVVLQEGISGDIFYSFIFENDDNPIVIWTDSRTSNIQLFMQILNSEGSTIHEKNGIPITFASDFDKQRLDAIYNENLETVAMIWQENRVDMNKIYAQAVDLNGNSLWDNSDLALSTTDLEQYYGQIDYLDGYYYTGWTTYNGDFINPVIDIHGQKIDIAGNLLWGDEGIIITDITNDNVITDIVGRYYIWQNESWPDYQIYAKLVDDNGNTATGWPEDGFGICLAGGISCNAKGFQVPQGLLVIWEDLRNDFVEIYGQLITPEGSTLWQDNGKLLASGDSDSENISLVVDEENFYMTWEYYDVNNYDIHLQKFDYSGNSCWQEDLVMETGELNSKDPDIVLCEDKMLVAWSEEIEYTLDIIKAQLVSTSGDILWSLEGEIIGEDILERRIPQLVFNGSNTVYSIWHDYRSGNTYNSIYNLYAQKINVSETGIFENNTIKQSENLFSNYPNPFNPSTTISFNLSNEQNQQVDLSIYNLKGQKVKTFLINPSTDLPVNSVTWNGEDDNGKSVSSGIYFYKLKTGNFEQSKKMLMIK